ncbi:hypothetical protein LCGC14_2892420 [marine sediment metagenome]|uniref:Uncharacterized protein n=1 Tax=marine sediment metagenome TaxID=412755 RepID=A0A0F8XX66_9ZZZZ
MAAFVFKDAVLVVNSVDLTAFTQSVTLNYSAELQDASVMGIDTRINLAGLKDWSIDVTFVQDFASAAVDATLFALVGAAAFPVTLKPTSGAISTTNPEFQGTAVLGTYNPFGGTVGDLAAATVTFNPGGGNLVRDVTP